MSMETVIRSVQEILKKTNPAIVVDGKAGPQTWAAIFRALSPGVSVADSELVADFAQGTLDERSERLIGTLLPPVRKLAAALVFSAKSRGIDCRIISGTRTAAEQDRLYAQGRTKPGPKVTNARAGYSNHNFGIAFDVGIFEGRRYLEESPLYKVVGALGQDLGLEWGGTWKSIQDEPHFQLRPQWAKGMSERDMLAQFRAGKEFHG